MADLLSDEEVEAQLPDGWDREGDEIVRTFEFDAYLDGVGFAAAAAVVAVAALLGFPRQEPGRALLHQLAHKLVRCQRRDHEDRHVLQPVAHGDETGYARHIRQLEIEDHHGR